LLDGVDDYASAPDQAALDLGTGAAEDFTIETFFYVPDLTNTTTDFLMHKASAYSLYIIYSDTAQDRFIFKICFSPSSFDCLYIFYNVDLTVGWHHVAAVYDNEFTGSQDLLALYFDGNQVVTGGGFDITPGVYNSSSPVEIGVANGSVNPFKGWIDEVRFSNVVRYSGSYTVPGSAFLNDVNTRALWHFNEALGATTFSDSSGNGNTLSGHNGAQTIGVPPTVATFKSGGVQDGWALETSETSNQGGLLNATATTFVLGDNASNRQYRSILHFNTSTLPDNAAISKVVLRIKRHSLAGTNPFSTHLKIAVDIRRGAFSGNAALQSTDFQAVANRMSVGLIANNPTPAGWYATRLAATAHPYVNRTGITQLRLRFQTDDDNDAVADLIRFYSGNAAATDRPVLVITYSVP
jgi:Concanavalin A-like lectin/glucanases superfamily